jgi:hypothetical protein
MPTLPKLPTVPTLPTPPTRRTPRTAPRRPRLARAALTAVAALVLGGVVAPAAPAHADNPPTPRHFTGYGFDQCVAPSQAAMDAWLLHSPFWAVGIYISGKSRGCRNQPNLTPAWVSTQLRNGWRLLPITLGPQASCHPSFPRYNDDVKVNPDPTNRYAKARKQGRLEARDAVKVAGSLGIVAGSTLWYDMEAYDIGNTHCRESALHFTSAWTKQVRTLGYVSGVYSSAGSHIKAMDDARVSRPKAFAVPDRIWFARWDGVATTSSSYFRADGWLPGGRMKQYRGDHNETHGGVTINIDSNWLDLGKGSVANREKGYCGGVRVSFPSYPTLRKGATGDHVVALQCLLTKQGFHSGGLTGVMDEPTRNAVSAMRAARGLPAGKAAGPKVWVALHARTGQKVIKYGAASERVRKLQRALNVGGARLPVTGVFEGGTTEAVKRYQAKHGQPVTGVVTPRVWSLLQSGKR